MSKKIRKIYRPLAWFFSVIIAAGTLVGCGAKKYGPPYKENAGANNYGSLAFNSQSKTSHN